MMHRPVLATAPTTTPVTLAEAKVHLRVNAEDGEGQLLENEDDGLITALIQAATDHLDGWTGILGRCLVEQEWRQDFDRFARCLPLPLGPVSSIVSVKWRDRAGVEAPVNTDDYSLVTDAGGCSHVRFEDDFSAPSDLYQDGAVSVSYLAGYPTVTGASTVPSAIKAAILLLVGAWYENREETAIGVSVAALPSSVAVDALIAPYRVMRI